MDTAYYRELARITSVIYFLRRQRDNFTDLSDIKEFLRLEELLEETIHKSTLHRSTPFDPLELIRQDWLRLVDWSNKVQEWISQADKDLDKAVEIQAHPTLASLLEIASILKQWPEVFCEGIDCYTHETQESDWESLIPYKELLQVVEAMGWAEWPKGSETFNCQELDNLLKIIPKRFHPIVASRYATSPNNQLVNNIIEKFKSNYEKTLELINLHSQHVASLNEIDNLLTQGQIISARHLFTAIKPIFSDLNYPDSQQLVQHQSVLDGQALSSCC